MALIERNARLRGQRTRVDFSMFGGMLGRLWKWIKPRKHPHIRELNARLARDAGINPSELARHQLRCKSTTRVSPRIFEAAAGNTVTATTNEQTIAAEITTARSENSWPRCR